MGALPTNVVSQSFAAGGARSVHLSKLLVELRGLWEKGQPAPARTYLDNHPELEEDRDAVLDLFYEEYCQRAEAGETVDVAKFIAQVPRYGSALAHLIASHTGTAHAIEEETWPKEGEEIAGYRLVRELGHGSFGVVFFATETALGDRPVALKVSKRLGSEPAIVGQLIHPNIVTIHSIREEPQIGKSLVCMPYLGKATLNDLLRTAFAGRELPEKADVIDEVAQPEPWEPTGRSPALAPKERTTYVDGILDLAIQLADALAFVHARNILHRDLKPSNVLLTAEGRAMLLDFNLSVDEDEKDDSLGGTLEYMSPEMLRTILRDDSRLPVLLDARSDVFSLGVILYQLLSGVHPYGPLPWGGGMRLARHLRRHHLDGPSSLPVANPQVPKALVEVVERCLAPNAGDRFASGAELAAALRQCRSVPARLRASAKRNRRFLVRGLATVSAAAVLLSAILVFREPPARKHYREGVEAYRTGQYTAAIESFNRAVPGNDNPAAVLFGRGWSYLQNGLIQRALDDFEKADKLQRNGRIKASIAEALSRVDSPRPGAIAFWYEEAIKANYETAPLLNNLAVWYYKEVPTRSKAEDYLKRALVRDPNLQVAHHNLLNLELDQCTKLAKTDVKPGLDAATKALSLGQPTAYLYYDAARMFALAAKNNPNLAGEALNYAGKAIENGFDSEKVRSDALFRELNQNDQLARVLETPSRRKAENRNQLAIMAIHLE